MNDRLDTSRYIKLSHDFNGAEIINQTEGLSYTEEEWKDVLNLPNELIEKLYDWGNQYAHLFYLDDEELKKRTDSIRAFDKEGLCLAESIKDYLGEGIKVSYSSIYSDTKVMFD